MTCLWRHWCSDESRRTRTRGALHLGEELGVSCVLERSVYRLPILELHLLLFFSATFIGPFLSATFVDRSCRPFFCRRILLAVLRVVDLVCCRLILSIVGLFYSQLIPSATNFNADNFRRPVSNKAGRQRFSNRNTCYINAVYVKRHQKITITKSQL
jgi:hypothetical protein